MSETTNEKLLPCPFCGGVAGIVEYDSIRDLTKSCLGNDRISIAYVQCSVCGVQKSSSGACLRVVRAEAAAIWNRRAVHDAAGEGK